MWVVGGKVYDSECFIRFIGCNKVADLFSTAIEWKRNFIESLKIYFPIHFKRQSMYIIILRNPHSATLLLLWPSG